MSATRNGTWVAVDGGKVMGCFVANNASGYSNDELADALDEANEQGFDLSPGSPLESITARELMMLVWECGAPN